MFEPRFRLINEPAAAAVDAYWMTHAGGSTGTLKNRMRASRTEIAVQVRSPRMPAHEELFQVSFDGDLNEMASLLSGRIAAQRESEGSKKPLVLIGHSFGSVLAYRMACGLAARGITPHRMVVLASPAPDDLKRGRQLHTLSDDQLIREVDTVFGGIPANLRDEASSLRFFLPGLRFDLALLERYEHAPGELLDVPIVAICGTEDPVVDVSRMQGWRRMTDATFRVRRMPGDHFFPLARMHEILQIATWDALPG